MQAENHVTTLDKITNLRATLTALGEQRVHALAMRIADGHPIHGAMSEDYINARNEYAQTEVRLAEALAECRVIVSGDVDGETWVAMVIFARPSKDDASTTYPAIVTRGGEAVDGIRWIEVPGEGGRFATPYPWLKTTVAALDQLTAAMHLTLAQKMALGAAA